MLEGTTRLKSLIESSTSVQDTLAEVDLDEMYQWFYLLIVIKTYIFKTGRKKEEAAGKVAQPRREPQSPGRGTLIR